MDKASTLIYTITAFVSILAFMCIAALIFSFQGCSTKQEIKYEQILVPTPQICDFNITYEPQISTSDMQNILKSVTDLSFDSKELRREIQQVPCLNINYKD